MKIGEENEKKENIIISKQHKNSINNGIKIIEMKMKNEMKEKIMKIMAKK